MDQLHRPRDRTLLDRAKSPSEQRIEETATRQIRDEYAHLGPARCIPFAGMRPHKSQYWAFRQWYDARFHLGLRGPTP